jgi:hypothetical protein
MLLLLCPIMKAVAVFILFVCFFLFTGYHDVHAETHYSKTSYLTALNITKSGQIKSAITNLSSLQLENNSLAKKKEDLSIDDGNEGEDFTILRKSVLITRFFVTLASLSILSSLYNFIKNRLPFCSHFSYTSSFIYILQRVLRI